MPRVNSPGRHRRQLALCRNPELATTALCLDALRATGQAQFLAQADPHLRQHLAHHPHIQWHHVLAMNAHIRGESVHPALAIEALKTDRIMDRVLQRKP